MFGLREEIKGLNFNYFISCLVKFCKVANLSGRVAGDIDDSRRPKGEQLIEECHVAAFAGRVNDYRAFFCWEIYLLKDSFCAGRQETRVADSVAASVGSCPVGAGFAHFHTQHLLEMAGEGEGERPLPQ